MEIEENYTWKNAKKKNECTIQLFQKAIANRHLTDEIRDFATSHVKKLYTLANTTKTIFLENTLEVMNVMQDILLNEENGLLLSELTRKTRQKIEKNVSHTYILHIIQHRQEFKIKRKNSVFTIDLKR